jgi:RND family efflux transporter MFP subunit
MKKRIIGAALILVLGGGGYYFFGRSKPAAVKYITGKVAKGSLFTTVSGSGNVTASKSAIVNAPVSGTIASVAVKSGDTVTAGSKLFSITNDSLDVSASKSYGSYLQSKQNVSNAQASVSNAIDKQNTVNNDPKATQEQKDAAAYSVIAARTSLEAAKSNLNSSYLDYQNQLNTASQRTVSAPIAGLVTSVGVNVGQTVGSGGASSSSSSTNSVTIIDTSSFKVTVDVNEVDAVNVKPGQHTVVTFDAISGLEISGKVESIDLTGTASQGVVSYKATIALDTIDARLKNQMSASAKINTDSKDSVLYVPSTAIKSNIGSSYVEVLENGKPKQVVVQTGFVGDDSTEVTSGLNEGEEIITQTIQPSTTKASATTQNSNSALRSLTTGGGGAAGGFGGQRRVGN